MNEAAWAQGIVDSISVECRICPPDYKIVKKGGEKFLEVFLPEKNDLFLKALMNAKSSASDENIFKENAYLKNRKVESYLPSPEVELLQNLLSESLTIGENNLKSDFHKKFIPFVDGEENRIFSKTNNIVFGRRGAGKSSLILYGCNKIIDMGLPYVWVAMQQYQNRSDLQVVPQFLFHLLDQLELEQGFDSGIAESIRGGIYKLEEKGAELTFDEIKIVLPRISRDIIRFARSRGGLYIFIDDLHLIKKDLQPVLLSAIYSFARGNDIYLKISSIQTLTKLYDQATSEGVEIPGDIQPITLDYNLVNPEKAHNHITEIVQSYVKYSGVSSLGLICPKPTRHRLTWVCAGVPRDALYIFNAAITKAINSNRRTVAITDINTAAADAMSEKEAYLKLDATDSSAELWELVVRIKEFCVRDAKSNAFLVHIIQDNPTYLKIKQLIDLRFLHILSPGITPDRANERYEALLLDYAFYTGFRRTPSIKEFKTVPESAKAKELRNLKRFNLN